MKYNFDLNLEDANSLSSIVKQIEQGTKVLEFGPANGRMTKYLANEKNCEMYFVEIDAEAAKDVEKIAKDGIVGDIEQFEWLEKWKDFEFDYITFADVLEHLRKPEEVLRKAKRILKPDGKILLSVPNVSHNSVLINLHKNIFNYTPVGLLDDTHIHLFAYNTLVEMCKNAGYVPIIEDATYSLVGENEIPSTYEEIGLDLQKILKNKKMGTVYQFLFTLVKKEYYQSNEVPVLNKIIPYDASYRFKAYFDIGNGWSEDNTYVVSFRPGDNHFEIPIRQVAGVRSLRLDPADSACIVEISKLTLHHTDGATVDVATDKLAGNGTALFAGHYLFDTADPQLYLQDLPFDAIEKIGIEIKYIDYDMPAEIIKEWTLFVERNQEVERGLNEELNRRLEELEHRMEVINECRNTINEQNGKIEGMEAELARRLEELEHRMDVINHANEKIVEQEKLLEKKTQEVVTLEQKVKYYETAVESMKEKYRSRYFGGIHGKDNSQ